MRATGRVVRWFHQQTRKGLWAHCRVSEAACYSRGGSSDALAASSKEAWERHLHAPYGGTHGFTSVLYTENICYKYALNSAIAARPVPSAVLISRCPSLVGQGCAARHSPSSWQETILCPKPNPDPSVRLASLESLRASRLKPASSDSAEIR